MSTELQGRYEKLLVAYPQPYRSERGEEIVATFMDASRDGQQWPTIREARELFVNGLRTRAWVVCGNDVRRMFLEGLWIYALYTLLMDFVGSALFARQNFGGSVQVGTLNDIYVTLLPLIWLGAAVMLVRGQGKKALALTALGGAFNVLNYYQLGISNIGISVFALATALVPLLGIAYLLRAGHDALRPRSYRWFLVAAVPVLTEVILPGFVGSAELSFYGYVTVFGALPALIIVVMRNIDPRFVVAAALEISVVALLRVLAFIEFQYLLNSRPIQFIWPWLIVIALQLAVAAIGVAVARRGVRKLALTI